LTVNQLVVGSIPTAGAKDFKGLEVHAAKPFFFANRPGNQKPAQRLQISAPPDDPGERRCDVPHLKRSPIAESRFVHCRLAKWTGEHFGK
jgi:hypothetical protein